jgi:hypothetical protein
LQSKKVSIVRGREFGNSVVFRAFLGDWSEKRRISPFAGIPKTLFGSRKWAGAGPKRLLHDGVIPDFSNAGLKSEQVFGEPAVIGSGCGSAEQCGAIAGEAGGHRVELGTLTEESVERDCVGGGGEPGRLAIAGADGRDVHAEGRADLPGSPAGLGSLRPDVLAVLEGLTVGTLLAVGLTATADEVLGLVATNEGLSIGTCGSCACLAGAAAGGGGLGKADATTTTGASGRAGAGSRTAAG